MPEYRIRRRELRHQARSILRGEGRPSSEELLDYATELKKYNDFGYARRLLARARERQISNPDVRIRIGQQHALCTYKDPDLPLYRKLDAAEVILNEVFALQNRYGELLKRAKAAGFDGLKEKARHEIGAYQETLGLAGAIYKRRWQVDAKKKWLEKSAYYYQRGFALGPETDYGYTGVNAAYVLDQLAWLEDREEDEIEGKNAVRSSRFRTASSLRRQQAVEIRGRVLGALPVTAEAIKTAEKRMGKKEGKRRDLWNEWWFLVTGAEACFGLGQFQTAREVWLKPAKTLLDKGEVLPWEFETCAAQLATLAQILWERPASEEERALKKSARKRKGGPGKEEKLEDSEAWAVVEEFLDNSADAARTVFAGKFGLGLSGGGFRASFFHIGVLARLAELDLLRHVHVLSCVSGGSIVGAHYYLELRELLSEKPDIAPIGGRPEDALHRGDYIEVVERMAGVFLKGVERNIRTRVVGNFFKNVRMVFSEEYSRTVRAGELYEKELYGRIEDDGKRCMKDLFVNPKGARMDFNPKYHNWQRRNKVPMLVLNATTLNTGHNWQFTASWMGESPFGVDLEIDGNWRYRRMYYGQAPEKHRDIRLGTAVGASACVPGLFEPVTFTGMYPKEESDFPDMTVRLVDGGVHDNQGIASLLEQDCSIIFVSDASGQMTSSPDPKGGVLGPLLRTNSVLMERVRLAQLCDLEARRRSSLLRGLTVVHLKKGLHVNPVSWKRCKEPPELPLSREEDLTEYGVLRRVQESLANIRTDLDSFSEVEAHSLMASGYLMARCYADKIHGLLSPDEEGKPHAWEFAKVIPALQGEAPSEKQQDSFENLLKVGSEKAFRIWRLSPFLRGLAVVLAVAGAAGFLWAWYKNPDLELLNIEFTLHHLGKGIFWTAVGFVAGGVVAGTVLKVVRYEKTLRDLVAKIIKGLAMSLVLFVVAWVHLAIFDPWFLRRGRARLVTRSRS